MGMEEFAAPNRGKVNSSLVTAVTGRRAVDRMPLVRPREDPAAKESLLMDYYQTLWRRKVAIALFALAGGLGAFLLTLDTQPIYRARTSLDIQNLNSDFMNMREVAATGDGGNNSGDAYVQTQIKLLQSDTLLERTVKSLQSQPHPAAIPREDLLSQLRRDLHLPHTSTIPYQELIDDTAKRVKIKPLGLTRLVEITCDSWDADFAANFCNTMTTEFQNQDREVRSNEADKTSEWLTHQVADVRVKVEQSEKKLEDATGGNGLILSQENASVSEGRLRDVQSELIRAQADRMAKQAQADTALSASPDSLPNVLDSAAYRTDQAKLEDLRGKVAELVPPLTEENPKVIHLRTQIREVEGNLANERATMMSRMKNEYDSARHREKLLSEAYKTQQESVSTELSKTSRVNLLRREVDSEQQLYQTLLQRAKEAGFASAMHLATIRVVDAARMPKVPFSPRRGNSTGVGLLLGSLVGLGFAFVRDRTAEVFRGPGDVERYLKVQELGVIPSSRVNRRQLNPTPINAVRNLIDVKAGGDLDNNETHLGIAHWGHNFSIVAEAYRNTTYSILLSNRATERAKVYVVSSPNAGDGKTTVVSNLGMALSQSKRRVVLIDGDLRKPSMHRAFMVDNSLGLRDVLRGDVDFSDGTSLESVCRKTASPNLWVIPSGSGNEEVVELLHSDLLPEFLARLTRDFDIVLIDTPPMLHMADARIFAGHANAVILVLRAGVTNRDQAMTARDLFEHDQVRLIGTILNDFDPAREGKGSYYESYYRYKKQAEAPEEASV